MTDMVPMYGFGGGGTGGGRIRVYEIGRAHV